MWEVWNKKTEINESPAEEYLKRNKDIASEDVVFLRIVNGRVNNVEVKRVLAKLYDIDESLTNDEFIEAYEAKIIELAEQARLEEPDEPIEEPEPEPTEPEPEPDETATYAELAQVYKEGVNGLE